MFSELDTDAFFAYAKAHHRDLVQQAEMDALRRRAARLRGHTLWRGLVAKTWVSGHPSQTPRTSRG